MKLINLNKTNQVNFDFDKPGDYFVYFYNLSGKYNFNIHTTAVNLEINGIYIGKKTNNYSLYTSQNHFLPGSKSNLLIKGVFYDKAKFKYQGLVRIEKEAQQSHAYQKNQNILMSNDCFVSSKPDLEILADDVFCTHGSTTGQLDKDQLLLLQMRGLSKKQAQACLVDGFISEIVDKIQVYDENYKLSLRTRA